MPQPRGHSVALVAYDRGPGISNFDLMRQDRQSGGAGAGIGIGAIERLSDRAEVVTGPTGTIWACRFDGPEVERPQGLDVAGLRRSHPTETVCGDAWATLAHRGGVRLALSDGMGHGMSAAEAGQAMAQGAVRRPLETPREKISQLVEELKGSRGGVISILDLHPDIPRMDYGNLGNISCFRLRRGEVKRLVTRDGYVGSAISRPMEEQLDLEPNDLVVLHSDGLRTVNGDVAQSLSGHSALMASALLLARHDLHRSDDISVAAVRWSP